MFIDEICTHEVARIAASSSVTDAAEKMRKRHVGTLVVIEDANGGHAPVGIVTDRDIVISVVAVGLAADALTVEDVMTQPVFTCSGSQDVLDAIAIMRKHGVRRLPVVDSQGKLTGIVAADDIWTALAQHLGALGEALTREQVQEMQHRT